MAAGFPRTEAETEILPFFCAHARKGKMMFSGMTDKVFEEM